MFQDSPGFAMENTAVVFPLSKRLAMFGKFDGPRGAVIPANAKQVALMNRIISRSVVRFIYSTDGDFVWQKETGGIGDTSDVFQAVREYKAKNANAKRTDTVPAQADPAESVPTWAVPTEASQGEE